MKRKRLKDRFNEHRRPVDRPTPSSAPTAVSDHSLSDNHSSNDKELVPLELINSSHDALLKAGEAYLIERGQTIQPKGINKHGESLILCSIHLYRVYYIPFYYFVIISLIQRSTFYSLLFFFFIVYCFFYFLLVFTWSVHHDLCGIAFRKLCNCSSLSWPYFVIQ